MAVPSHAGRRKWMTAVVAATLFASLGIGALPASAAPPAADSGVEPAAPGPVAAEKLDLNKVGVEKLSASLRSVNGSLDPSPRDALKSAEGLMVTDFVTWRRSLRRRCELQENQRLCGALERACGRHAAVCTRRHLGNSELARGSHS